MSPWFIRQGLPHRDEVDLHAAEVVDLGFAREVACRQVELEPRARGHQLQRLEASRARLRLADLQQLAAETAAGPVGMDEEGADAGGLGLGVELLGAGAMIGVRTEQGLAPAPAAAGDRLACVLGHPVGAVGDQAGVDPEGALQRRFDLGGGVLADRQAARRKRDQPGERRGRLRAWRDGRRGGRVLSLTPPKALAARRRSFAKRSRAARRPPPCHRRAPR